MSDWTERALAVASRLEQGRGSADTLAASGDIDDAIEVLRAMSRAQANLADQAEIAELLLETKQEELATLRSIFAMIVHPIIEVSKSVLCVPVVGPVDADSIAKLSDTLLTNASSRRARLVIIDLTGATIADATSAGMLISLIRSLELLGVKSALTGISPTLATVLSTMPEAFTAPFYRTVAAALASESLGV